MITIDLNAIKNEYNQITMRHNYEYNQRMNGLYTKHPKLKQLQDELVNLRINKTKLKIANTISNEELKQYEDKIETIKKQIDEYKQNNKITDYDMSVHYSCEKCKDQGYVDGRKCDCFKRKEIEYLIKISNFDIKNEDTFENLKFDRYNQKIKIADNFTYMDYMKNEIETINHMILNIDKKPLNIVFTGPSGTGKTFLSRCIGNKLLKMNKSVFYITVADLISTYINNTNDITYLIDNSDLLILDNFGKENISYYSISVVFDVIDKRLIKNMSTIIATNYGFKELSEYYDDNICSRLINDYYTIKLYGEDLRRLKNV